MDTTSLQPQISTHHTHLDPPNPYAPAFIFHLTRLTSTLFVWVGTAASASGPEGSGGFGAGGNGGGGGIGMEEDGAQGLGGERKLAADWGVAMPSRGNMPVVATPVFRSGAVDLAVPMAQRLARKFPSNQIHLSLSLPANLTATSGPSLDPLAGRTLLVMEKELGKWLEKTLKE